MKSKIKKEMEYEMAPSGYVTLYNYKEPFMPYRDGAGYLGVLLFDGETDKVQCHLCGNWYVALGNHLHKEHAMSASAYKEEVGLNNKTALIGEKMRAKLIASGQSRFKNLVSRKGITVSEETKEKIRNTLKENRLEAKNKVGTCPAQLIDRLQKLYQKLGRTPTTYEITFYEALKLTYGSLKEACQIAGIPYRKEGQTVANSPERKRQEIVDYFAKFLRENKRFPRAGDCDKDGVYKYWKYMITKKLSKQEIMKDAVKAVGSYEYNPKTKIKMGKEGLVAMMRHFEKVHGRVPSVSDARRKLIAPASSYYYYFKTWKEAVSYAFPKYEK